MHLSAPMLLGLALLLIAGCTEPMDSDLHESQSGGGRVLPDAAMRLSLPAPAEAGDRAYLGLAANAGTFSLQDIDADLLVVEVLSPYCKHCQATAPRFETVIAEVRSAGYPRTVRFLGSAIDVNAFVVERFRKTYDVSFPVIPDPEQVFGHALGVRTIPHFLVIDMQRHAVVYEVAKPDDLNGLLMAIRNAAM